MKVLACLLLAGLSVWGNVCHAEANDSLEEKLVGAWQEGLGTRVKAMSPSQQQVFVGNVMVFSSDHRFRIYPKCGPEAAAYKAKHLAAISGAWHVSNDNVLHIVMTHGGKTLDQAIPVTLEGNEMVFGRGMPKASLFGKYEGALPPQCPLN